MSVDRFKRRPQDAVVSNVARLRKELRDLQKVVRGLVKQLSQKTKLKKDQK